MRVFILFRELAALYYFSATSFSPDVLWTKVDHMTCKALLVRSQTNAYKMSHTLYCNLSHALNQHLHALTLYFKYLLKSTAYFSIYLQLGCVEFNTKVIDSFLESATLAGCTDIIVNVCSRSSLPWVIFSKDVCCLLSPISLCFIKLQLPTLFSPSLLYITLATCHITPSTL